MYRKVKDQTNLSPSELIRHLRMQEAQHLLKNTDLSIGEIASKTGFKDSSYFSRIYKSTFGETPLTTRK